MGVGGVWWWQMVADSGGGRPLEATEASSCALILAQALESTPLPTPPGRLTLRLFEE